MALLGHRPVGGRFGVFLLLHLFDCFVYFTLNLVRIARSLDDAFCGHWQETVT